MFLKDDFSSIKKMNKFISKVMSSIYLKWTWEHSKNFCLKWSIFIIKQNINKKLAKFTCKPQLAFFIC